MDVSEEKSQPQQAAPLTGTEAETPTNGQAEASCAGLEEEVTLVPAAQLQACREELATQKDQYLRARADLENYRRRVQREKEDLQRYGNEQLLREILPVVDNLERALAHARTQDIPVEGLITGVEMTLEQFQRVLEKFQVRPVAALQQPFDSACHEAMGQVEREDCPPNTVVEEMQRGYMLNDRLLRPALVLVSKAAAPAGAVAADA
jgi:molecular chaperone GrpE